MAMITTIATAVALVLTHEATHETITFTLGLGTVVNIKQRNMCHDQIHAYIIIIIIEKVQEQIPIPPTVQRPA